MRLVEHTVERADAGDASKRGRMSRRLDHPSGGGDQDGDNSGGASDGDGCL